jgi:hypothetical protein
MIFSMNVEMNVQDRSENMLLVFAEGQISMSERRSSMFYRRWFLDYETEEEFTSAKGGRDELFSNVTSDFCVNAIPD